MRERQREKKNLHSSPFLCIYFSCLLCFTLVWRAIYFQWHKMTIIHLQGAKGTVDQYQWPSDLEAKREAVTVVSLNISASFSIHTASVQTKTIASHRRIIPALTQLICSRAFKVTRDQERGGSGGRQENTNEDLIYFALGEIDGRYLFALCRVLKSTRVV